MYKWLRRWRDQGEVGLVDGSSRPRRSPRRTPLAVEVQILSARVEHHAGPVGLASMLDLPASTVGAVLRRWQVPRLAELDRLTGELLRQRISEARYEHPNPGSLLHVDVKKLGRVPAGGGWRVHGRDRTRAHRHKKTPLGFDFVHVAVDDHSRAAYAEVLPDERDKTCAAFLHRAAQWFRTEHGVAVRRVLTDNAMVYRHGSAWTAVCSALQIKRRFIKPGCPWTNGKAERFNRTLQAEWAYARPWTGNPERTAALTGFLDRYNTRRGHSALNGRPPVSRLAA